MEYITEALANVFTWQSLVSAVVGVLIGIVIGALPGLSVNLALSIMIPVTYAMDFNSAMMMLLGIFVGGVYGGSYSAILISTPGTPAAAATVLDGYQMAKNGRGGTALATATISSFIGGMVGVILLIFISPLLSKFGLKFSSAEVFSLTVFGLSIIISLSEKSLVKSLIAAVIGLLLGTVGVDTITGVTRFTYGNMNLYGGLSSVALMIGLFALSEMVIESSKASRAQKVKAEYGIKQIVEGAKIVFRNLFLTIRSGIVGTFIGAIPGPGATTAAFVAYNDAKTTAKNPEEFGKGAERGVVAPEAANNGVNGGAMIPLLTLGIPGDAGTALLLGAFILHGLTPGPMFYTEHTNIVYFIFIGIVVVFLLQLIMGLSMAKIFVKILEVPKNILIPIVCVLCFIGAYGARNSMLDVLIMLGIGVLAFFLKKMDYPPAPLILGFILGPLSESEFRRALLISHNSYTTFFSRPISLVLLVLAVLGLIVSITRRTIQNKKKAAAEVKAE